MDDRMPHYLRFARTLALATTLALPACSDGGDSSATDDQADPVESTTTSSSSSTGTTTPPVASATPRANVSAAPFAKDVGIGGASPGKISGPLPPPEMPASMA
ncbi:MAG: hypothetical protein ABJE95_15720 [Byssovorax sp.]